MIVTFLVLGPILIGLALYALALGDLVFLIANAGASIANGIVAVASVRARRGG